MQTNRVRILGIAVLLALMVLIARASASQAQQPARDQGLEGAAPDSVTAAGSMGVEWITDWPGTADDRANWYYSANNLYAELKNNAGWYAAFNWGQTNAWERDWKANAYGGNGLVDTVDLAMIGTHGTSAWDPKWGLPLSAVYFSSNNDDWFLSPGEAYRRYGTNNLEWIAFDSCSVLRDDSRTYWHEAFNGLHLMMGFANTMYVVYPGDGGEWGDLMQKKGWWIFGHGAKTVTQAWFTATEDQQPSTVLARVLAEELNSYNDYIWGQGYVSPDYPNNGGYWYWDHWSGTPEPLQLQVVPTSLPVYIVVPRMVNQAYVEMIGQAFGLSGRVLSSPDGSTLYMAGGISDTQQLRVDAYSGGFLFQNLGELWTHPEMTRTLPSPGAALELSNVFLRQNAKNLPGALGFDSQIAPTVALEGPVEMIATTNGVARPAAQQPLDYAISYARSLDIGNGQRISVVGPGSRQNVYLGDGSAVIGMKGGWRDVQMVLRSTAGIEATTAVTVLIKTAEQAWADFLADPSISLAEPPLALAYDRTGKPDPTLAYYEQALAITQTELIPVWLFVADLYTETVPLAVQVQATNAISVLVASDVKIYVPAEASPMALPQATIDEPAPGTVLRYGTSLDLAGSASGGMPPYSYLWSSSKDGILGTGPMLTIPGLSPDVHGTSIQPNTITLLVTDANGQTATDSVDVTVYAAVYMPVVLKNGP
jgi:hypothetical protein